ncbi:MAG: NADH-quinone oxidoreductase subunit A [Phycisphaerae bacterium]
MVGDSLDAYAAIGVTILLVLGLVGAMLILAHTVGPKRRGPVKDSPYESGMPVIGDSRRRFRVRFYVVAILFLLLDVELVFLWPWGVAFYRAARHGATYPLVGGGAAGRGFLLVGMLFFFVLLVLGLVYEWKKGAFEWD